MPDTIKPGETLTDAPLAADATLGFIGHVETPWKTRSDCPKRGDEHAGPDCRVILNAPWDAALKGIEAFERLDILMWFDQARRDLLTIDPEAQGRPVGVFARRGPVRPNPIAVTGVRLLSRQGNVLVVRGLDAVDGTPVIDVKPRRRD